MSFRRHYLIDGRRPLTLAQEVRAVAEVFLISLAVSILGVALFAIL
jgi:hypothetical protein